MSKKGIFALAIGYLAWVTAATFYWKSGKALKKNFEKAEEEWTSKFQVFFNAFIDTHTNMINSIKQEVLTEKNIELYNDYKNEALKIFDSYKEKWLEILEELKEKWVNQKEVISKKFEELYNSKSEEIEKIKWITKEASDFFKEKLKKIFSSTKEKIEDETEKKS